MIVSRITGGLGNQMFQYAAGLSLAHKHKTNLLLDVTGYDQYPLRTFDLSRVFSINPNLATKKLIRNFLPEQQNRLSKFLFPSPQRGKTIFREPHFHFTEELQKLPDETYLDGYWQSEKYFIEIEETLRRHFEIKMNLSEEQGELLKRINSSESVAVHIRRGDYVSNPQTANYHGNLAVSYYQEAIRRMKSHFENARFYFFSDDMTWVREAFQHIDHATFSGEYEQEIDLLLMKSCKHQIVANSSFSWWGAWLNDNPDKKVVAPQKWFGESRHDTKDLIPDSWERL